MSDNKISRYKEREQAFLICFEKMFSDASISEISECAEESRDDNFSQFALQCAKGVEDNLEELDKIISDHLSAKWKLNRISKVSLSILRLAVYEMKFVEDIPTNVTINEAVELSKKFSGEEEYKFVNGILGAVSKDI